MIEQGIKTIKSVWPNNELEISKIRKEVFILEQNVPEEMEWDEFDQESLHWLVMLNKKPIATARIRSVSNKKVKIERLAVLKNNRREKIATNLMNEIIEYIKNRRSSSTITLNAQTEALNFYDKLGFKKIGDTFIEAGIEHIKMELNLQPLSSLG